MSQLISLIQPYQRPPSHDRMSTMSRVLIYEYLYYTWNAAAHT